MRVWELALDVWGDAFIYLFWKWINRQWNTPIFCVHTCEHCAPAEKRLSMSNKRTAAHGCSAHLKWLSSGLVRVGDVNFNIESDWWTCLPVALESRISSTWTNLVKSHLFLIVDTGCLGQTDRPTWPGVGSRTRPSGVGGWGRATLSLWCGSSPSKQRDDSQIRCCGLGGDSKATTCSQEGLRADFPGQVLKVGY